MLNGVPLVLLAAAYAAVTVAVLPALWRHRGGTHPLDWAVVLVFPAIAFAAGVFGVLTVVERRPLGGHTWVSFAATLAAFLPVLPILVRWRERAFLARGVSRSLVAEERASSRDRELAAVSEISVALARARVLLDVARPLAAHVARLLRVGFVGVVLVDEGGREAHGVYAESSGEAAAWWAETTIDLRGEPSGIARAYFDAAPITVYDIAESPLVSPRLATLVGAQSGAWVPMITEERVVGVLVLAATDEKRAFAAEELSLLQAVAAEAALAFERLRSAAALAEALERERRAAEIVRRLRAELDPDEVVRVAREELGEALALDAITIDIAGDEARVDVERATPLTDRRADADRDRQVRDRRSGSDGGPARGPLAPGARAARLLSHRIAPRRTGIAHGGIRRCCAGSDRSARRRLRRSARPRRRRARLRRWARAAARGSRAADSAGVRGRRRGRPHARRARRRA